MRILSQDVLQIQDLPYEKTRVYLEKDGITVKGLFDGIVFELAKYSTEAKARKAMEMLREVYSPVIVIKEHQDGLKPNIKSNDWLVTPALPMQRIEVADNFYFQFPADDEVEV